ncbi:ABC-2 type transport system permease protein [Clostridium tetanomorphum]|uniref:ABC transporter permease n=1 Tax=Clostridium tetanomorphum TaxID=1553 RepID=A0A923EA43_CLOTT|nr:ABC transporter permease [Clostridium tetanomorphum]KAJ52390.1 ABC transporter permease [Clostridium tetanomorphum DSM 665]MBC2397909.1 ABC transporter permease [Clostridium tetanomorphum]MBP1864775.1 ABC-2 type transport system permease protein [Clostridium tetanomorphum]NRS83951.1 ABC-2 type transport system permease protein [Clostridium tetanomorphum]NRZ97170.1 ABC-2 type transport system permease protein [Clostridium tetanomorphum]
MRVKATIKVIIKAILSQWKQVLLMFAILPLIISVIMSNFQKDTFKPEVTIDKINISIIDEDNSKTSNNFKDLFNRKELREIFNITNNSQYEIIIPKGYENNLINKKESTIKVNEKKRVSRNNELIIKSVIEQYGKSLTETMVISNKIQTMDIQHKDKLFNEVISNINKVSSSPSIKENIIKGERVLKAIENQAATMMTFMVFSIIMSCIAGYDMDKKNGSNKRLISTPITKCNFFNLDVLVFFIASLIYSSVYILAFRITGLAFKGVSVLNIISILICQSLLIGSTAGIIIAFFGKKTANTIVVILMYAHIIFGGGFIPLKEINNNIFLTISRFSPGNVISETYRNCILFNSFNTISKYLIIMIGISLILYSLSILKVKIRWED